MSLWLINAFPTLSWGQRHKTHPIINKVFFVDFATHLCNDS